MKWNIIFTLMKVGDEGIKRGSRWFVMTAVIVKKSHAMTLANKMVQIKTDINIKKNEQLHWTKLSRSYKKRNFILNELKDENFNIIHVAIDTNNITYLKSADVYPYFLSYLFERVSYFLSKKRAIGNFIISTRSDYKKEKYDFITNFLSTKQRFHKINISKINSIKYISNNKIQLLQLADVCCSSFSQCLVYNDTSHWDLEVILKDKIVRHNNTFINAGIKFFPPIEWVNEYPYLINFY